MPFRETPEAAYLDAGKTEEQQAAWLRICIQPRAECSEHGTGYAVDILSADYTTQDTGFAATRRAGHWRSRRRNTASSCADSQDWQAAKPRRACVRALALAAWAPKTPSPSRQHLMPGRILTLQRASMKNSLQIQGGGNTIGTYSLHFGRISMIQRPAEKFNRCRISIQLWPSRQSGETATAHALLPLVLERGYADCPDMTRLTKKLARLEADLTVDARPGLQPQPVRQRHRHQGQIRAEGSPSPGNIRPLLGGLPPLLCFRHLL